MCMNNRYQPYQSRLHGTIYRLRFENTLRFLFKFLRQEIWSACACHINIISLSHEGQNLPFWGYCLFS